MSPTEQSPRIVRPAYLDLLESGELARRVDAAYQHLEGCDLCASYCYINRRKTKKGAVCRTGELARVHSAGPHHGEEDPLRGWNGSGTIFFSWCNLRCVFCQNWEISQEGIGYELIPEKMSDIMLSLQNQDCHNINFVTPSHVVAQIIAAVQIAAQKGLNLPLVYNTGGYDSLEALALLDGIIYIYMPDIKSGDTALAHRYSHVRNNAVTCLISNSFRAREAPTPTNISINSDAEIEKKGTPPSPASARASNVLTVPGGPISNTLRGISAPSSV